MSDTQTRIHEQHTSYRFVAHFNTTEIIAFIEIAGLKNAFARLNSSNRIISALFLGCQMKIIKRRKAKQPLKQRQDEAIFREKGCSEK